VKDEPCSAPFDFFFDGPALFLKADPGFLTGSLNNDFNDFLLSDFRMQGTGYNKFRKQGPSVFRTRHFKALVQPPDHFPDLGQEQLVAGAVAGAELAGGGM
jgi:hypothetical protein